MRRMTLAMALAWGALGCSGGEPSGEVTWYADAEPIVAQHCMRCHNADGLGVGDFTDPEQAVDFASLMLSAIDAGRMPPPTSDPSCREYLGADAMSLDFEERDILAAWVEGGAVLGDPADSRPVEPQSGELDSPDLELRIPAPYTPVYADPENVDNEYRCFVLESHHDADFYLTAMAPIVDQTSILHHAVLLVKDRSELTPEERAPTGYNCMGGATVEANGDTVVAWAPGMLPVELPPDTGVRVREDQVLVLQIHYFQSPGSEGVADQSGYAFRTAPSVGTLAQTKQAGVAEFLIPAGDAEHAESGVYSPRVEEEILGVFPHMHTLGDRFYARVLRPDGTDICVVDGAYDFDNQLTYQFSEPLALSPDDRMEYTCVWNNSSSNPEITGKPVDTRFGERTDEEMCVFFTLVRQLEEDVNPLQAEPVDPTTLPSGGFQLNFASEAAGTFIEDGCLGTLTNSGDSPAVTGMGACTLQGALTAFFGPDPKPITLSGDPNGGVLTVDFGNLVVESDWTGSPSGTAVFGTFDGKTTVTSDLGQAEVLYAGGFHIDASN
ncbi:MAG: hypothetical protein AAGA48_07535 [Myxococcota bacterium]